MIRYLFKLLFKNELGCIFVACIFYLTLPKARAEDSISSKYQFYQEDEGRIEVKAYYLRAEKDLDELTSLSFTGLIDDITGATPSGQPAPVGSDQVPLSTLTERRKAFIGDIARKWNDRDTIGFEFAYSTESDYVSRGYSVRSAHEFNKKNTSLNLGYSFIDDDIAVAYQNDDEQKRSHDFIVGVTQLLDPNTVLTANVTYGVSRGYLSDPYKLIQKETEIIPGFSLPLTFGENRPRRREKVIGYIGLNRFFEELNGGLDSSYRAFWNDHGINSHTVSLEWFQKIGSRVTLRPGFRFYDQSAADYYYVSLDNTTVVPSGIPNGVAPYYSADYRLSAFRAYTYGLKMVVEANEWLHFDIAFERYEMKGRDGLTSQSAYPDANVFTVGGRIWF
jgi:hypothetical protein